LVLPTGTLPKLTAAGLALTADEGTELGVAELELITAEVEFPLALVTPVQPERTMADAKRVEVRNRTRTRELGRACRSVERNREREFLEGVDTTR
jgi:hypothetical protein